MSRGRPTRGSSASRDNSAELLQLHDRLQDVTGKIIGDSHTEFVNCSTRQFSRDAAVDRKQRQIVDKLVAEKERWERQVKHALEAEQDYVSTRVGRQIESKSPVAAKTQGVIRLIQEAKERLLKSLEFPNTTDQTRFKAKVTAIFTDLSDSVRSELPTSERDAEFLRLKRDLAETQEKLEILNRDLRRKETQLSETSNQRVSYERQTSTSAIQRMTENLDSERKLKSEAIRDLEKANAEIAKLQRQLGLASSPLNSELSSSRYRDTKLADQISRLQRDLHQGVEADSQSRYYNRGLANTSPERNRYSSIERSPYKSPVSSAKATEDSMAYLLEKEKERSLTFYRALKRKERECEDNHGTTKPPLMEELSELSQRLKESIDSKLKAEEQRKDLQLENQRLSELIRELKLKQSQTDQATAFKLDQADRNIKLLNEQLLHSQSRTSTSYLNPESPTSVSRQRAASHELDRLRAEIDRLKGDRSQENSPEFRHLKAELDRERQRRDTLQSQLSGHSEDEVLKLKSDIDALNRAAKQQAEEFARKEDTFTRAIAREKEICRRLIEEASARLGAVLEEQDKRLDEYEHILNDLEKPQREQTQQGHLDSGFDNESFEVYTVSRGPSKAGAGAFGDRLEKSSLGRYPEEVEVEIFQESGPNTTELQTINAEMMRKLSDMERHSNDLRSTLKQREIEMEQLKNANSHTEEQLKQAKLHETQINLEVEKLQAHYQQKLKEANSKHEQSSREKQDMASRVLNIEKKQEDLARQNKNKDEQLIAFTQEIRRLEMENEAFKTKIETRSSATVQVDSLEKRMNQVVKTITQKDEVINKLERERGELGTRLKSAKSEVERYKEAMVNQLGEKTRLLTQKTEEAEHWRNQVRQLQQSHTEIESELNELKELLPAVENSTKDMQALTQRVEDLGTENARLIKQIEMANSEGKVFEKRAEKALAEAQSQETEVKRLRKDLENMRRSLSEAERHCELLKADNEKLEHDLNDKEQELLVNAVLKEAVSPATAFHEGSVTGFEDPIVKGSACPQCHEYEETVNSLENDLKKQEGMCRKYEDAYKEMKKRLEISTNQQEELQRYLDETRTHNTQLEEELDTAVLDKEEAEKALENQTSTMKTQAAALEESRDNSERLDKLLKDSYSKLQRLQKDYKSLQATDEERLNQARHEADFAASIKAKEFISSELKEVKAQEALLQQRIDDLEYELSQTKGENTEDEELRAANTELELQVDALHEQLDALQNQRTKDNSLKTQLTAQISELQGELAKLNAVLDEKFEEVLTAEQKVRERDVAYDQLRQELEQLNDNYSIEASKLKNRIEELELAKKERDVLQDQLAEAVLTNTKLNERLQTIDYSNDSLEDLSSRYNLLQQHLEQSKAREESLSNELQRRQTLEETERSAIANELKGLRPLEGAARELRSQIEALKLEVLQKEDAAKAASDRCMDLETELETLDQEYTRLENKYNSESAKTSANLERVVSQLEATRAERQTLRDKLELSLKELENEQKLREDELQAQAENALAAELGWRDQLAALQSELEGEKAARAQLSKNLLELNDSLSNERQDFKAQLQEQADEYSQLLDQYARMEAEQSQSAQNTNELEETRRKLRQHEENHLILTEENEAAKQTLEERAQTITRLEAYTSLAKAQIEENQGRIDQLNTELTKAEEDIDNLNTQLYELKKTNAQLAADNNRLTADQELAAQHYQGENERMEDEVTQAEAKLDAKDAEILQLEHKLADLTATNSLLSVQLNSNASDFQERLEENQQQNETLQEQLKQARQTVKNQKLQLDADMQDRDTLKAHEIERLTDEIEALRNDALLFTKQIHTLQAEVRDLQLALDDAKIREENASRESQRTVLLLQNEKANLEAQILDLKAQQTYADNTAAQQSLDLISKHSQELEALKEFASQQKEQNDKEYIDLQEHAEDLAEKLESSRETIRSLESQLAETENLRETQYETEQELEATVEKLKTVEGIAKELRAELDREKDAFEELKASKTEVELQSSLLVESLRAQLQNTDNKADTELTHKLRTELQLATNQLDESARECESLKSRLQKADNAFNTEKRDAEQRHSHEKDALEQEIHELSENLLHLEAKDASQVAEIDSLKHLNTQLKLGREMFEETIQAEHENEIASLEDQISQLEADNYKYSNETSQLIARIQELEEVERKLAHQANYTAPAEAVPQSMERPTSLTDSHLEIEQLEIDLSNLLALYLDLKKQHESQAIQLNALMSEKSMSSLRLESEVRRAEQINKDLMSSRAETEQQRNERNRLSQQLQALQEVLKVKEDELSNTKRNLNTLTKGAQSRGNITQSFESSKGDSLSFIRSQSDNLRSNDDLEAISELEKKLTDMSFRLAAVTHERDDLSTQLVDNATDSQLADQYQKAIDRINRLETELRIANENISRLEQYRDRYNAASEQAEKQADEVLKLQRKLEAASRVYTSVNLELQTAKVEKAQIEAENSRLEEVVKTLESQESMQSMHSMHSKESFEEEDSFYDLAQSAKLIERYVYEDQEWCLICFHGDQLEYNWWPSKEARKYVPSIEDWPETVQAKIEHLRTAHETLQAEAEDLALQLKFLTTEHETIAELVAGVVPLTSAGLYEDLKSGFELLKHDAPFEEVKLEKAESNEIEVISGRQLSANDYDRDSLAESIPVSEAEFANLHGKLESFNDIVHDYETQINAQSTEIEILKQAIDVLKGSKETQKYTQKVSDAAFKALENIGPQPSDVEVKIDTLVTLTKMPNDLKEALRLKRNGGQTTSPLQTKKKGFFSRLRRKN